MAGSRDLKERALEGIERYRASDWRAARPRMCRFEVTCSHYAEHALRRHSLPVAALLIVWRVLRCNPLTATRRDRRRVVAVLALAGFTTLLVSGAAAAAAAAPIRGTGTADTAGGCKATVGGQPIGALTSDHPLLVRKGQSINVSGSAPAGSRGQAGVTTARIHFIEKWLTTRTTQGSTGTTFQKIVNVDNYLKYGSGRYRVDAISKAPGTGGWECTATFYVELDGSKLGAVISLGVGAVGAAAVVVAIRGDEPAPSEATRAEAARLEEQEKSVLAAEDRADREKQSIDRLADVTTTGLGCLAALLGLMIVTAVGLKVLMAMPPTGGTRRVWVKGHPVVGFFGGLIGGLGFLVAGWQLNKYALTPASLGFPLFTAVLGAVRARLGRPWKLRTS